MIHWTDSCAAGERDGFESNFGTCRAVRALLGAALLLLVAAQVSLAAPPIADPGDPPNLKRYEGSKIFHSKNERFTKYDLILSKLARNDTNDFATWYTKKLDLEGALTRLDYYVPDPEVTTLEVIRNYSNELKSSGWEVLFEGVGEKELGGDIFGFKTRLREAPNPNQILDYPGLSGGNYGYLAAHRAEGDGDVYVTVYALKYGGGLNWGFEQVKEGMQVIRVDVIKPKAMEQKMVTVSASEMAKTIAETGRISLYGIHFDTNKSAVKPESKGTLEQIATLLKGDAALKLNVIGHTDNVGGADANLGLSKRRADAVKAALIEDFGVDGARLEASGAGMTAPVADNGTEEGRAKNRRVELVKR